MKALCRLLSFTIAVALVAGCGPGGRSAWVVVHSMDLPLTVEAVGVLKAVESAPVALPSIPEVMGFKIAQMAPESRPIRKGQPLLILDTSDLVRELEKKISERDLASKEIEKRALELRDRLLELDRQRDEARANLRKTRQKVEVPDQLQARVELDKIRLDLKLAEEEVHSLEEQRRLQESMASAEMQILAGRRERAARRVGDLEEGIRNMTVGAPRDGLVIYSANWRGEKRKPGDTVSRFDQVLQVADLNHLGADATVGEVDVGRVQAGQTVTLRLESDPEREHAARVVQIDAIVAQEGWNSPRKVAFLRLSLERTDPERMRPGMRFRATVQVGREPRALVIPMDAVLLEARGPVVYRGAGIGRTPERVPVKLGSRNGDLVQVVAGLKEGDRILRKSPVGEERGSGELVP